MLIIRPLSLTVGVCVPACMCACVRACVCVCGGEGAIKMV